jgi:hypothetical protein
MFLGASRWPPQIVIRYTAQRLRIMAGKFMRRTAIVDLVTAEHRVNAVRKRKGLLKHPLRSFKCECNDDNCGGTYLIDTARTIPTEAEARALLVKKKRSRKSRRAV